MANLRFSTAQQIIDAFPVLKDEFKDAELHLHPFEYVRQMINKGQIQQALALCAFMLPKREAVQWLCESLRQSAAVFTENDEVLLKLAEDWAHNPSEKLRGAALSAAMNSGFLTGPAWAAAAAGWSGGDIGNDPANPAPPPPHLTGQAVKSAFTVAYWSLFGDDRGSQGTDAIKRALAMVRTGS